MKQILDWTKINYLYLYQLLGHFLDILNIMKFWVFSKDLPNLKYTLTLLYVATELFSTLRITVPVINSIRKYIITFTYYDEIEKKEEKKEKMMKTQFTHWIHTFNFASKNYTTLYHNYRTFCHTTNKYEIQSKI